MCGVEKFCTVAFLKLYMLLEFFLQTACQLLVNLSSLKTSEVGEKGTVNTNSRKLLILEIENNLFMKTGKTSLIISGKT